MAPLYFYLDCAERAIECRQFAFASDMLDGAAAWFRKRKVANTNKDYHRLSRALVHKGFNR